LEQSTEYKIVVFSLGIILFAGSILGSGQVAFADESCRNCGGSLTNCSLCAQCKEVIGMICVSCGTRALERFHDSCLYMVEDFQTKSSLIENGEYSSKIVSIS